ncbi:DNA-processing protein DprA [Acinetobacter soli]|uniref:DNA-processing protein DprA n=1 Tax=Acinetobacter soli TaxID=487316 RepID=UPI00280DF90E|nr:DNA-processing protein DprA [Acinetobacter soli]MDQ8942082.1 DNA-processing protein DprA [Acinetobacter soli]
MNSSASLNFFKRPPINIENEVGAYEFLWSQQGITFKRIAELFKDNPNQLPSELVEQSYIKDTLKDLHRWVDKVDFNISLNGTIDYPHDLRDATYPVELFYYKGWLDLIYTPKRIAIVGTRNPTEEGIIRTRKLTKLLVEQGYTIFSGLAKGVDTIAHKTAIENNGCTVAVIGTPIIDYYPPENKELQDYIAEKYLLVSQVPIKRYHEQNFKFNKIFFPERNATMSALSQATVIVEAGETSGSLIQARAALKQGRKLFILESCFNNPNISWPRKYEKMGATRVRDIGDIVGVLEG